MRLAALLLTIAGAAGAVATAAELAPELQHLEQLANDEAALSKAVRDFDKQQVAAALAESDSATELAKQGKKDEAKTAQANAAAKINLVRQAYEYLLKSYPKNARAHNYYGELLYDQYGDDATALTHWNLATSLDPNLSAAYNNLGIHYCHTGQYQLGLDAYDRALAIDPEHPDYLFNLAQAYLIYSTQIIDLRHWKKAKVYKEAMKLSKKTVEVSPQDYTLAQDYANNFYAAENFGVKANWTQAAEAWQAARKLARNEVETFFTWLNEGRVWIRQGNKTKAAECLNEAIKLRPNEDVPKKLLDELQKEAAPAPSANRPMPAGKPGTPRGRTR